MSVLTLVTPTICPSSISVALCDCQSSYLKKIHFLRHNFGDTQCCSWLRHCPTSWKDVGLIPSGVTGIFYWHNPSSCTMALGLTQPLGGKGSRCIGLTTLSPSCANCCETWEPQPPGTPRVCPGLYRDFFAFRYKLHVFVDLYPVFHLFFLVRLFYNMYMKRVFILL